MRGDKIRTFMQLAGQKLDTALAAATPEQRKLGAHLLLSEVLEYVIAGLGVVPVINGQRIEDPEMMQYELGNTVPNELDMLDGLSDTAYTMYWNALAFGLRLEEAFDLVCDNNLQKFVQLNDWSKGEGPVSSSEWDLGLGIKWPAEVVKVQVQRVDGVYYGVGKDKTGKVRKPSSYRPVELGNLVKS